MRHRRKRRKSVVVVDSSNTTYQQFSVAKERQIHTLGDKPPSRRFVPVEGGDRARPLSGVGGMSGGRGLRGYRTAKAEWRIFRARRDNIPSSEQSLPVSVSSICCELEHTRRTNPPPPYTLTIYIYSAPTEYVECSQRAGQMN
jgi:hypothetical protein